MTAILSFFLLFNLYGRPPGTVKVKDYYVDRTEVQNIQYLEYLYYKKKELDSTEWFQILPDSSNFWYTLGVNRNHPIVSITFEQAVDFCAWRSQVVSKRKGKKITYRLPTPTEWREIATEIIRRDRKAIEMDLVETKRLTQVDPGEYTMIGVPDPDPKVYNMFDNVSEMTSEKGIALGSNNFNLTDIDTNLTLIKYKGPNTYLGFRCIAEME